MMKASRPSRSTLTAARCWRRWRTRPALRLHITCFSDSRGCSSVPRAVSMSCPLTFSNGVYVLDQDGLRVDTPRPMSNTARALSLLCRIRRATVVWTYYLDRPRLARIDPAQIPAVRDRWLMVLGRPLLAIPYWCIAGTAALLPAAWVVARNRRWVRARARPLPRLRLRPPRHAGRCPECGTVPAARLHPLEQRL